MIVVDTAQCDRCGACISVCRSSALVLTELLTVLPETCTGCAICVRVCPNAALTLKPALQHKQNGGHV